MQETNLFFYRPTIIKEPIVSPAELVICHVFVILSDDGGSPAAGRQ